MIARGPSEHKGPSDFNGDDEDEDEDERKVTRPTYTLSPLGIGAVAPSPSHYFHGPSRPSPIQPWREPQNAPQFRVQRAPLPYVGSMGLRTPSRSPQVHAPNAIEIQLPQQRPPMEQSLPLFKAGLEMEPTVALAEHKTTTVSPVSEFTETTILQLATQFCMSGWTTHSTHSVQVTPLLKKIVDGAESSAFIAAECARLISKMLQKDHCSQPSYQYNAIILLHALSSCLGTGFTRHLDDGFVAAAEGLFQAGSAPRVQQVFMQTLNLFRDFKCYEENFRPIIDILEKERPKDRKPKEIKDLSKLQIVGLHDWNNYENISIKDEEKGEVTVSSHPDPTRASDSQTHAPETSSPAENCSIISETEHQNSILDHELLEEELEILEVTLQAVFGLTIAQANLPARDYRPLIFQFVKGIHSHIRKRSGGDGSCSASNDSRFYDLATPDNESFHSAGRKRRINEDQCDASGDKSRLKVSKKLKSAGESGMRFSCPYRKRNPEHFNVREAYSCAMTYFETVPQVRQHILKKHSRKQSRGISCQRCKQTFESEGSLQSHLRRAEACDFKELDPLEGIDKHTFNAFTTRSGNPGRGSEELWPELWKHLFPDDLEAKDPHYQVVMEHFDLSNMYLESLPELFQCFDSQWQNEIKTHFLQVVARCETKAREMSYTNNQSRRKDLLAIVERDRNMPSPSFNTLLASGSVAPSPSIATSNVQQRSDNSPEGRSSPCFPSSSSSASKVSVNHPLPRQLAPKPAAMFGFASLSSNPALPRNEHVPNQSNEISGAPSDFAPTSERDNLYENLDFGAIDENMVLVDANLDHEKVDWETPWPPLN